MDRTTRAAVSLVLAAALSVATPVVAFADPGVDATVGSATISSDTTSVDGSTVSVTLSSSGAVTVTPTTVTVGTSGTSASVSDTAATVSAPTLSVATTGTTASVGAPPTTVSVGPATVTPPDLSNVSTGSGGTTVSGGHSAPGSHATGIGSSVTSGSGSTLIATEQLSQGIGASVAGDDGFTRTSVRAGAVATAVICLLADLNVLPTNARVSSLCASDPSTANGTADVTASNGIAGVTVGSGAAIGAAVCLLGLVSSPVPGGISAAASLTTLCGDAPSTLDGGGTADVTSDRTGTSVSAAPLLSAALCLLANGNVGTQTVASLSTMCAGTAGAPSTAGGSAGITATDVTTGSSVDLAPAANAAACVLLNALAAAGDPSASASLGTACGPSTATTPSTTDASAPGSVNVLGVQTDPAPAVNAAVCILTNAQLGASGGSASITDACPAGTGTGTRPDGGTTPPTGTTTAPGDGPAPAGTAPSGATAPAVGGVTAPAAGAPAAPAAQPAGAPEGRTLASLPSSATATAGLGLFVASLLTLAALGRRRRR